MKARMVRGLILASAAVVMFVSMGERQAAAQRPAPAASNSSSGGLGSQGGVRGDAYPVQVVVKLAEQPVAGVTVTFKATNSATATTDANGVASISLKAGHYTVTASNDSGAATKTIAVVASTDTLIVGLSLVAKTP